LLIKEAQINELADTLKQLPDSKLLSCIQDVEKYFNNHLGFTTNCQLIIRQS
jgi:hypothetical protein